MKRSYERLDILTFGRHLLDSGDLDPVYIALNKMDLPEAQLHRWLVAYWCFYHCGLASYISGADGNSNFWRRMREAADNTTPSPLGGKYPRGHERRHFRGDAARRAISGLVENYPHPSDIVHMITAPAFKEGAPQIPFKVLSDRAQTLPLFGPWISFKVGDMVDRVLQIPVDFALGEVFMFTDPVKAALMLWRQRMGYSEDVQPKDKNDVIRQVVAYLKDKFSDHMAPPMRDRPVDLQEVETILCKWKSHMNGHYPLNNDIDEIVMGLSEWSACSKTAGDMTWAMPKRLEA